MEWISLGNGGEILNVREDEGKMKTDLRLHHVILDQAGSWCPRILLPYLTFKGNPVRLSGSCGEYRIIEFHVVNIHIITEFLGLEKTFKDI